MEKKKWFMGILLACVIAMGTLYPCMSVSAETAELSDAAKQYAEGVSDRADKIEVFCAPVLNAYKAYTTHDVPFGTYSDWMEAYHDYLNKAINAKAAADAAWAAEDAAYANLSDTARGETITARYWAVTSLKRTCEEFHKLLESPYKQGIDYYNFLLENLPSEEDEDDEEPEVVTSSGEAISTTIPTSNTSDTTVVFTTPEGELNAAAAIEAGNYVTLSVEGYVGDEAKKALNNAAQSAGGTVSRYLDISLNKWTPNGASNGKVTQLNAAVEIVVGAPEGVDAYSYDFAVLRIHDGVVTILPDLDNDPATITFATDRFSAYAVIYGEKGSFDKYKTSKLSTKDNVPKTGDPFPVAVPAAVVLGVLMGALTLRYGKRI